MVVFTISHGLEIICEEALGIPLQPHRHPTSVHRRLILTTTTLIGSQYRPIHRFPCVPDFDFKNVKPSQSRQFYDWFFDKGVSAGGMATL
jgi:hypothetical protein